MAKRRTGAQIRAARKAEFRFAAKGLTVADRGRRHGITERSDSRWRRREGDASDDPTVRARESAVQVERLQQLVAEVMSGHPRVRECARKRG